jgi:hypothetical protein
VAKPPQPPHSNDLTLLPVGARLQADADQVALPYPVIGSASSSEATQQKLLEHRRRRRLKKNKVWLSRGRFVLQLALCASLGYGLWIGVTADFWRLSPKAEGVVLAQTAPTGVPYVAPTVLRQAITGYLAPLQKAHPTGVPLVLVSPKTLETSLLSQFPVLQQVVVSRQLFPARITVAVLEKQAWATVYNTLQADEKPPQVAIGAFQPPPPLRPSGPVGAMVASQPLLTFTPAITPTNQGVPIIASSNSLLSNPSLKAKQWRQRIQLLCQQLQLLATQYPSQLGPLRWVSVSDPHNVQAAFGQDTDPLITLEMGESDDRLTQRLERLVAIIPKLPELRSTIKAVDLRWQHELVLQKRPTATP